MEKVALNIQNLCKVYPKDLRALDEVNLKVNSGDFYALLGPNGAGKSTLIGIISSIVNKTSGKVEILGIDIDKNHALAKKKMGIVGQEVNFNQFETVYQILTQQAGYYGLNKKVIKNNSSGSKKLRGYIFSRSFMGERAPQHVQNIIIRDYCKRNNFTYFNLFFYQ